VCSASDSAACPIYSCTVTYTGQQNVTPQTTTDVRWRRGVVVVTLRRAQLVLGWVTVFGREYHHGNAVKPPKPTLAVREISTVRGQ